MTEHEQKLAFARAWLMTPDDPWKAGVSVVGNANVQLLLVIASQWTIDGVVLAERKRILDKEGALAFLPSKADHARELWNKAQTAFQMGALPTYEKLMRQYGEIMGHIEKGAAAQVTVNNTIKPKVVVVRESATSHDWERNLAINQSRLTAENVTTH